MDSPSWGQRSDPGEAFTRSAVCICKALASETLGSIAGISPLLAPYLYQSALQYHLELEGGRNEVAYVSWTTLKEGLVVLGKRWYSAGKFVFWDFLPNRVFHAHTS